MVIRTSIYNQLDVLMKVVSALMFYMCNRLIGQHINIDNLTSGMSQKCINTCNMYQNVICFMCIEVW